MKKEKKKRGLIPTLFSILTGSLGKTEEGVILYCCNGKKEKRGAVSLYIGQEGGRDA